MTMKEEAMVVGIDVSKQHLDVGLHPVGLVRRVGNDHDGLTEAVDWLSGHAVALVVMEATGRLHELAAQVLRAAGLPVAVVNPGRVRHFARAKGHLAKTDRIDALVLGEYGAVMKPTPGQARDMQTTALAALVLRRRQLVTFLATERHRLESIPPHARDTVMLETFQDVMAGLQRQISAIERRIDDLITGTEGFREQDALLRSVPGVGPVLSQTLIAEVPELGSLTRRQIASLVGLAPISRDSGTFRGQRSIHGGRSQVRRTLYMAAIAAIRCNPKIRAFHQRLIQEGKRPKVAITAAMRKMLVILNAIARDNRPWQTA